MELESMECASRAWFIELRNQRARRRQVSTEIVLIPCSKFHTDHKIYAIADIQPEWIQPPVQTTRIAVHWVLRMLMHRCKAGPIDNIQLMLHQPLVQIIHTAIENWGHFSCAFFRFAVNDITSTKDADANTEHNTNLCSIHRTILSTISNTHSCYVTISITWK